MEKDLKAAVAWYLKAAEQGHAEAQFKLGDVYQFGGAGVDRDLKEAFKWFKAAADRRDPPAATSCGVAYINGSGVARNHTRGICMITIAATLGSEHACSVLGWANECGHHGFACLAGGFGLVGMDGGNVVEPHG